MSRSYRKTPCFPYACAGRGAMKWWKRKVNRRFRRREKQMIHHEEFSLIPTILDEIETSWTSPIDGKIFAFELVLCEKNPDLRKNWLREYWRTWRRK